MKALAAAALLPLLLASSILAATPPIVTEALKAMDNDDREWSFVQTTVDNGKTRVERFDPSRPIAEQWTLTLTEDRAPTPREQTEYREKRAKERVKAEARKKDPKRKEGENDLIREDSLVLLRENAEQVVYSFRPPPGDEDEDAFADHIKGTLTIGKSRPHAFTIEMKNDTPLKPMTGVRIDRFAMTMEFRPVTPRGPVLPFRFEASVRGKALLLKSLNQDTVTTFSEYRRSTGFQPALRGR
ncbi:MAG: hypothetical protein ACYC7A_20940 [Thermoanaerobaculia bacterium]